jgi:hypothetical protein
MNDSMQSTRREGGPEEEKPRQSVMEKALIYFFGPSEQSIEFLHLEIAHIIALCVCLIIFFLLLLLRTLMYVKVEAVFIPIYCFHILSILIDLRKRQYIQ